MPTGNIKLLIKNEGSKAISFQVNDLAYKKGIIKKTIAANGEDTIVLDLKSSFGWYDFEITANTFASFSQRFAGRIETGKETYTDPLMGRV